MIIDVNDYLMHYGTPRHSGRYPWGSGGEDSSTRNKAFLDHVADLRKQGLSETEISKGLGLTVTQLRDAKTIAKNAQKQADISRAEKLRATGMSNMAIAREMGINESSVRALLQPGQKERTDILKNTADMLKEQVAEKTLIDIGTGVENHLMGISRNKLNTAVQLLKEEGYKVHYVKVPQIGTGKPTTVKVLGPPGMEYSEVFRNRSNIRQISEFTEDGGRTFDPILPPKPISSKRVGVRYAEEGGDQADGVIYVRPGVDDVSLGRSRYAQVRIAVDGTHYLKGMAMYKDDLPDGVDLLFNTNKKRADIGDNKLDAMKKLKDDPENPFGAVTRQRIARDADGTPHVTSVMNIVASKEGHGEEGGWEGWSRNLSSQFLSKQSPHLAKQQLDLAYDRDKNELDRIMSLTNPAVKRKLLESFADGADASAIMLKAAALPRQATHVILPVSTLKDNEVYAPKYRQGERVVLIRHPHGGTFELPELVVNNRHPDAKKLLGENARDAIGINHKVAARLSGADFDGDTVVVVPNNRGEVKTSKPLKGLEGFDPQSAYPPYDGMKTMSGGTWDAKQRKAVFPEGKGPSGKTKQAEMGNVSNLITDMTIGRASDQEIARAVRHSMVVIDAEKHNLDFRRSAQENGITGLKKKYQGGARKGASTVISNAGLNATKKVDERKPASAKDPYIDPHTGRKIYGPIDPETGKKVYVPTGRNYIDKQTGERKYNKEDVPKLALVDDAHHFSSGTVIEDIYANHSNSMKALANQARREMVRTKPIAYSPSAKQAYANEVSSLDAKLNLAIRNRPLERQAQIIANAGVAARRQANPHMSPDELKKVKSQELDRARTRTGAKAQRIEITDREWAAIQAGAISNNKLTQILNKADLDQVKKLATPKVETLMSPARRSRAATMLASGYTLAEVADHLGVSVSTLTSAIDQGGE